MRPIKFRGVKKSDKTWIIGDLANVDGKPFIFNDECYNSPDDYEVILETVGQFTGLQDSKGVDLYEGDHDQDYQVVMWCDNRNGWAMAVYDFPTKEKILCHCYSCEGNYDLSEVIGEIQIIGNIHRNT